MGYAFVTQLFPILVASLLPTNPVTKEGAFVGVVVGVATVAATNLTHTSVASLFPGLPEAFARPQYRHRRVGPEPGLPRRRQRADPPPRRLRVTTLLIVWSGMTGGTRQMAEAAAEAASEVTVRLLFAREASAANVLDADGFIFATAENLAAISGGMKDFFDRTYYAALDRINGRAYATMICAGSERYQRRPADRPHRDGAGGCARSRTR